MIKILMLVEWNGTRLNFVVLYNCINIQDVHKVAALGIFSKKIKQSCGFGLCVCFLNKEYSR